LFFFDPLTLTDDFLKIWGKEEENGKRVLIPFYIIMRKNFSKIRCVRLIRDDFRMK